jgi:membrane protein YdbS with pleckstrin-like domain
VLGALVWAVPVGIGCLAGGGALAGSDAPGVLAWLAWALAVGVVAVGGVAMPLVRWRTWRYEVRDEEIDLLRGAVVVRRTLIPMTRVQHVDTQRTPLSDLFELSQGRHHTLVAPLRIRAWVWALMVSTPIRMREKPACL